MGDDGIFHAVRVPVHAPDAEHGGIKIEAVEEPVLGVLFERGVVEAQGKEAALLVQRVAKG